MSNESRRNPNLEHKDQETDNDDQKINFSEEESDVMSNEEFQRRVREFRRSGGYLRRRTNIRLTMNSADNLRNDVLNIRRQIQTIINDTTTNTQQQSSSSSNNNNNTNKNDNNNKENDKNNANK